jgi:hypothetical protein
MLGKRSGDVNSSFMMLVITEQARRPDHLNTIELAIFPIQSKPKPIDEGKLSTPMKKPVFSSIFFHLL